MTNKGNTEDRYCRRCGARVHNKRGNYCEYCVGIATKRHLGGFICVLDPTGTRVFHDGYVSVHGMEASLRDGVWPEGIEFVKIRNKKMLGRYRVEGQELEEQHLVRVDYG